MRKEVLKEPIFAKEIAEIIKVSPSIEEMREQLRDYHENDIAQSFEFLNRAERNLLYSALDAKWMAEIIAYIDNPSEYIEEIGIDINEMDADDAVDLWEDIDESVKVKLRPMIDDETKTDIRLINSYDEDEIGSLITTNYICIRQNLTIRQAMHELIRQAGENDNITTIYVVDEKGCFCGAIDLKDLIIARQDHPLEELVVTSYPYVYAEEEIDECIERLKDYSEDSVPVLDNDNRLLGVITSSSIIELVDDEMGEDYAKLAGLTAEEDLKEPLKESMKKRMPWLLILLALGMIVSSVVGMFETVVTQLPIIMCFQSLILDMAGNVGTQSLAVTIRVLMDETLTGRQKAELVLKEMRIGLCNGGLLGILSFVLIGLYIFLFKGKTLVFAYAVSGCIGLSLLVAMLVSSAVGTCIPLFFKKVGVDPAVASGPLITTVNDLVAVITYYGMSWIFLIEMFHLAG